MFAYFVAVASVIGGTLTYPTVVRPVLRSKDTGIDNAEVVVIRRRSATLLASSGLALVVAAYLQLAGRVARADTRTSSGEAAPPHVQGGDGATPTPGTNILALRLLLVTKVGATFYAAHRASLFLTHHADASGSSAAST